jgi:hypothetical protein
LTITAVNRSAFPVTIDEAGVLIDKKAKRLISVNSILGNGGNLPFKMEARTRLSIRFPPDFMADPAMKTAECAYVFTECGEQVEDKSGDMKKMMQEA